MTYPAQLKSAIERGPSLSTRLAERLEEAISDGVLALGTGIPSERELAEQFAVSRTVVREAVRTLVAKGLLDVRAGAGTVVTFPSLPDISRSVSMILGTAVSKLPYEKVSEVRRLLELEIAGLAAERRNDADLAMLEAAVDALVAGEMTREEFVDADMDFHLSLARATQNELLVILADSVAHVMIRVRQAAFDVPGTVRSAHYYHARLLSAVKRGDGPAARSVMKSHLTTSDRLLRKVRVV